MLWVATVCVSFKTLVNFISKIKSRKTAGSKDIRSVKLAALIFKRHKRAMIFSYAELRSL